MRKVQPAAWSVAEEGKWRMDRWSDIKAHGDPRSVPAQLTRELGIYSGFQRMYVCKERTKRIHGSPDGVTLSVKHTGKYYADDLHEIEVIYHYPETNDAARDAANVRSTNRAKELGLPVFVIVGSSEEGPSREVRLGWVVDSDGTAKTFRIVFGESPPIQADADVGVQ